MSAATSSTSNTINNWFEDLDNKLSSRVSCDMLYDETSPKYVTDKIEPNSVADAPVIFLYTHKFLKKAVKIACKIDQLYVKADFFRKMNRLSSEQQAFISCVDSTLPQRQKALGKVVCLTRRWTQLAAGIAAQGASKDAPGWKDVKELVQKSPMGFAFANALLLRSAIKAELVLRGLINGIHSLGIHSGIETLDTPWDSELSKKLQVKVDNTVNLYLNRIREEESFDDEDIEEVIMDIMDACEPVAEQITAGYLAQRNDR